MPHPLGDAPSKIIAVHLNYRGRARERGRVPAQPSYFLKPPSSLSGTGDPIVRPRGCELLAFEGEIALVIGERASRVPRGKAWSHVRWLTAANDAGVHDLRYADRGSNLRSKGADGFTPAGPRLLDASIVDPAALRLRTWVNGEVVQDATTEELLFGFDYLLADLSRLVTLEPGDVVLTGTPAGSSVVDLDDVVEVELSADGETTGRLRNQVAEADHDLAAVGALPHADETARAAALGPAASDTPALTGELRRALAEVSTATLSSQLRKREMNGAVISGLHSLKPELPMVGAARTLRYLPLREDLFEQYGKGMNTQKRTIDEIQPGEVLVMDARGEPDAGTIGDILGLRAQVRGAAGIVTDGAVRDSAALADLDMPTYCATTHPAVLGRRHVPWDAGIPVACGGALVRPGDILVGDGDGIVVIPPGRAAEIADAAREQERQERFIAERVGAGESVEGLYPLGPSWRGRYDAWTG